MNNVFFKKYFLIIVGVFLLAGFAYAIDTVNTGFRVDTDQSKDITAHEVPCKKVTNTGTPIFVPTKLADEWQKFREAVSRLSGVSLSECCTPITCAQTGCGAHDDGCGEILNCVACPPSQYCGDGICDDVGTTTWTNPRYADYYLAGTPDGNSCLTILHSNALINSQQFCVEKGMTYVSHSNGLTYIGGEVYLRVYHEVWSACIVDKTTNDIVTSVACTSGAGETCSNCPSDCGACAPVLYCGDGTCNNGEICSSCPGDCKGTCNPDNVAPVCEESSGFPTGRICGCFPDANGCYNIGCTSCPYGYTCGGNPLDGYACYYQM